MNVNVNDVLPVGGHPYRPELSGNWFWAALVALTVALAGAGVVLEEGGLRQGTPVSQLFSFGLTSYANLLLFASGLMYIAHVRFTAAAVGKWATGLAMAGAMGLMAGFLLRWYETYRVLQEGHIPLGNLYEVVVFFSALTVIIYLAMEAVYRVRIAGAFVMPIVMCSVAFEIWLAASGNAEPANLVPPLKSYWLHAHVLASFIAYGAFAVAAGAALMYLVRARAEKDRAALSSRLPDLATSEAVVYQAINIGFPLFSLATILGAAWAHEAWGGYWSWDPKEILSLIVWLVYAAFFHLRYMRGWSGARMAWWALLGFVATLFCFLGVNLFLSGLHSYGQAA